METFRKVLMGVVLVAAMLTGQVDVKWAWAAEAPATEWPTNDIVLIVPYRPGGGYDINARIIAPFIMKYLPNKVNLIVKNVPGAEAKIGTLEMANSKPDGHTLALADPVQLGTMHKQGGFKSVDPRDFAYLGQLYAPSSLMLISAASRFKKIEDMRGQNVSFGMLGDNTLVSIAVAKALNAKPTLIAYDSTPEGCMAVARGDLDVWISAAETAYKQVQTLEGKLTPLMLIGAERPSELPKTVKSATELGLNIDESIGLKRVIIVGPPRLDPAVVNILVGVIDKAIKDPEAQERMKKAGYTPDPLTGEKLKAEVAKIYSLTDEYDALIPKKN